MGNSSKLQASSRKLRAASRKPQAFYWQDGYGAFSVAK